jgi:hypothetical protein
MGSADFLVFCASLAKGTALSEGPILDFLIEGRVPIGIL